MSTSNHIKETISQIKQQRDEIRLKLHLAGREARDEWEKLETRWEEVEGKLQPLSGAVHEAAGAAGEHARKVAGAALDVVAGELHAGYARLRRKLD